MALPPYDDGCQDDPAKVACDYPETAAEEDRLHVLHGRGRSGRGPAEEFTFTNDDQNVVAKYISEDGMSPEDAAAKWVEDNADKVAEWTS